MSGPAADSVSVPAAGGRRAAPAPAHLRFFHGPMDCGKSTPQISSRVGLRRAAEQVDPGTDLLLLVRSHWAAGRRVDYLVVDEAQFLTPTQVDQLAGLVDASHVDVYAFGLTTDFRTRLFPGTRRLLEVADDVQRIQVEVLCWCGAPGLLNARVVDGAMVRSGATVVVADTAPTPAPGVADDAAPGGEVHYQVLCWRHHVLGQLGPTAAGPGQLALP
ncbi:thymidine kinase [Geodermatophilus sp. URMC 63]